MQRAVMAIGISILAVIILPFSTLAQAGNGFEIHGNIKGLKEGEKVILKISLSKGFKEFIDWERKDSSYVKNGEFHILGNVPEGPRLYFMEFNQHPANVCRLLISNKEKINISSDIDIDSIPHNYLDNSLKIEGSPTNLAWHILSVAQRSTHQIILTLNNHIRNKESVSLNKSFVAAFVAAREDVNTNLYGNFLNDPDPLIAAAIPFFIIGESMFEQTNHAAFWKKLYDGWDEGVKRSYYGRELYKNINLCEGQTFPEFSLPATDGKLLSLKDVSSKEGLTIVEFWSSHSVQRKEYQDELRELYKKYHGKGLEIVGISSDTVDYEWNGFVNVQQYPWRNVSDLKGAKGVVGRIYHEFGSPEAPNTTNVLLDSKGKILGWDLMGAELEWYIAKYLGVNEGNSSRSANVSTGENGRYSVK